MLKRFAYLLLGRAPFRTVNSTATPPMVTSIIKKAA